MVNPMGYGPMIIRDQTERAPIAPVTVKHPQNELQTNDRTETEPAK